MTQYTGGLVDIDESAFLSIASAHRMRIGTKADGLLLSLAGTVLAGGDIAGLPMI